MVVAQHLPEDDVAVSADVLPSINCPGPLRSGPGAEPGVALIREGLEVPLPKLKHVLDAVCAHGHHHLRTGLQTRGRTFAFW